VTLVLFIALFFGVFAFGCVVLWASTDSRFGKYAFQRPAVTRSTFFSKDKELADWLMMYYTTRVFLVCFVVVVGYYLYRRPTLCR
jgi:hypothetical protein